MSWLKGMRARARSLFNPRGSETRMEEEFGFHVEMETARLVKDQGLAPGEALRQARASFGGFDHHREEMRDGRGARWVGDIGADVRYALRVMRRSPGFALAVALTLGLGIGVNGMIFEYVNALLFHPVPGTETGRLVAMFNADTRTGQAQELAYEDYLDFRDKSGVFDGLAGMTGIPLNVVDREKGLAADMVWGEMVTENFFAVLGMRPALGRFFAPEDASQGSNPYAVLSFDSWTQRFRGDSGVIGRVLRINGTEFTVTGVAARGFRGMRTFGFWPEIWAPVGMHDVLRPGSSKWLQGRGGGWMMAFGRMRAGWSRERTMAAATLFAKQLEAAYPASNKNVGVTLIPAGNGFDHPQFVKPAILVLASSLGIFASVVTLLIICANLANLQLARASAREREIGIRLSLGCSRTRLSRQLLVESLLFAVPGAAIAAAIVAITPWTEGFFMPHLQFRVGMNAVTDQHVVLYTLGVALFAAVLFGLVPALKAARSDIAPSLAHVVGSKRRTRARRFTVRDALVVSQLALSMVLLVGGMLFVRSLIRTRQADLGYDQRDRLLVSVNVGLQGYDQPRGRRFYDDAITAVRALAGVTTASWAFPVPFDTYGRGIQLFVDGITTPTTSETLGFDATFASEDFVDALGLRLQQGRSFVRSDSLGAPDVMIVSRSLASRLWPGKEPIGQHARLGSSTGPDIVVVGVVADARFALVGETSQARAYLSTRQRYRDWETLVIHTRGDPLRVEPEVRRVVASLDPMLPLFGATTMEQSVTSGLSGPRSAAYLAGFFGALALLIASIGLYAVVASRVAERTREIGVRVALGSTPGGVMRYVMRGGARLGAWGLGIGIVGALTTARLIGSLLLGVSPNDPFTFVMVPAVLATIVVVATWLPARRAVNLDPVQALRNE